MKHVAISLCGAVVLFAASFTTGVASPPTLTGTWQIQQSGNNGSSTSTVTLTQSGSSVIGNNAANGNGFTGTFVRIPKSTVSGTARPEPDG